MAHKRYIKFYLANGMVEDSRLKNWKQVAWDQVIQITARLAGHTYTINCKGPGFKTFMNFKWGGQEFIDGKYRTIKTWTIGWTDGRLCFLKDIDFRTGNLMRDYIALLSQFKNHLHPAVKDRVLGI